MYIYVFIYIYTYMYVYMYVYICMHIYKYIRVYTYIGRDCTHFPAACSQYICVCGCVKRVLSECQKSSVQVPKKHIQSVKRAL